MLMLEEGGLLLMLGWRGAVMFATAGSHVEGKERDRSSTWPPLQLPLVVRWALALMVECREPPSMS
jgi:hypothetical protein